MELRPYQNDAVSNIVRSLQGGKHPVAQLPTGSGKSLIISELTRRVAEKGGSVWVLAHVAELISQNAVTYERHTNDNHYGIICSGLRRKDTGHQVTFATIQSLIGVASSLPSPSLIIVDEVHRVPNIGVGSQYEDLFKLFPDTRRVGLSATPWRLDNGLVYGKDPEKYWLDDLCFRYTVPEAVRDGWLCPLVGVETEVQLETPVAPLTADFNNTEVAELETKEWLGQVANALLEVASKRKHFAVYCPTVVSAMRAASIISKVTGWTTAIITGGMSQQDRAEKMTTFRSGKIRVLCSIETLTTGWDFPALDCIVCLRPTTSSSLFVQMMGRGTRLSEDKKNCLFLDFVGNLRRLGGVEMMDTYVRQGEPLAPVEAIAAAPREPRKLLPGVRTLAVIDPMTGKDATDGDELIVQVHSVSAVAINTRRNPASPVLMVQYACTTPEGARIDASLFVTTETLNGPATEFFARRRLAVRLPQPARGLQWTMKNAAQPSHLTVRKSGRYFNVIQEHFSTSGETTNGN